MRNFIILILFSFNLCAQTKVDTSFTGQKTDFYDNGNPKSKISYVKGKPHGLCILYYEDKKIKELGTFVSNRWVGSYKQFYPNGIIQHSFTFDGTGKRIGLQWYYSDDGSVSIISLANDNKEAITIEFDKDGHVTSKIITDKKGEKLPPGDKAYIDKGTLIDMLVEIVKSETIQLNRH